MPGLLPLSATSVTSTAAGGGPTLMFILTYSLSPAAMQLALYVTHNASRKVVVFNY